MKNLKPDPLQPSFDLSAPIAAAVGDRGFSAPAGKAERLASEIYDAICPRDPSALKRRLKEPRFVRLQRRRGSTEGRVANLKQRCARRLRCRGFEHRYLAVAWAVLGHDLWGGRPNVTQAGETQKSGLTVSFFEYG